jgi:HPr kinase/phosphorylase
VRLEPLAEAPVALIADLVVADQIERLPTPCAETILGIAVPRIAVAPFEASAAAKIRLALRAFTGSGLPAIMRE